MISSPKNSVLQNSMSSSTALLRSAGALPRRSRPHCQIRGLRLGLWSSYLEPAQQVELRRQYRELKRASSKKFAELDATWNKLQKHGIGIDLGGRKAFMCSAWRGEDRTRDRSSHSINVSQTILKTSNGIEDVEQSALDKVLNLHNHNMRGMGDLLRAKDIIRSRTTAFRKVVQDNASIRHPAYGHEKTFWKTIKGRAAEENSESLGEIDPITNRRVYKNSSGGPNKNSPSPAPEKSTANVMKTVSSASVVASDPARECLKDFPDNDPRPVYGYEPDGQKPMTSDPAQQELTYYDAITKYGVAEENPGPADKNDICPVKEGLADYDAVTKYGVAEESPGPDNTATPCPVEEGLAHFDGVTKYGVAEENPGPSAASLGSSDKKDLLDYDHVTKYGVAEESSASLNSTGYEHNKQRVDPTAKVVRQEHEVEDEGWRDYDGKVSYAAPDFQKSPARKETVEHRLSRRQKVEEDFKKSQEMETLNPAEFRRQLAKNRQQPTVPSKESQRKLTGNYGRDFPEESQAKWKAEKDASGHTTLKLNVSAHQKELFNNLKLDGSEINETPQQMSYSRNQAGAANRMQTALDRMSKAEEESAKNVSESSQQENLSSDLYSKTPQGLETSYNEERKFENEKDPYSRRPQGLETNFSEEQLRRDKQAKRDQHRDFVREIRGIYEEKYGPISNTHRQIPKATAAAAATIPSNPEPISPEAVTSESKPLEKEEEAATTLYKILAYDPTMQSINTAETTSIVHDSASPLTPAEVLLRLSNPAKFFPHFAPLQAQGYEIVSGSGDVLVFRKVRAAGSAPAVKSSEEISEYQDRTRQTTTINPIDGMRPVAIAATGNFASPTGFVNYDVTEPDLSPSSSSSSSSSSFSSSGVTEGFKSHIDVRREEPVFSGKRNWSEDGGGRGGIDGKRRPPGVAKRVLLGGAAFGGVSYAIGVVAEYFKTGGSDGRGPQGF